MVSARRSDLEPLTHTCVIPLGEHYFIPDSGSPNKVPLDKSVGIPERLGA